MLSPSAQKDRKQERLMKKQKQEEELRLAEEKSQLGVMRNLSRDPNAGRRSLMRSRQTGMNNTFGG
jgi:hypothetical protein